MPSELISKASWITLNLLIKNRILCYENIICGNQCKICPHEYCGQIFKPLSEKTGFVKNVKAEKLGKISCELGAGRVKKEDIIDNQVGLIINKKIGDKIEKDEIIAIIHANDELKLKKAVEEIMDCFEICEEFVEKPQVILGIVE